MGKRKGDLTITAINQNCPHQIIIPADWLRGGGFYRIHDEATRCVAAPRSKSVAKPGKWHAIFCLPTRANAETFKGAIGGE